MKKCIWQKQLHEESLSSLKNYLIRPYFRLNGMQFNEMHGMKECFINLDVFIAQKLIENEEKPALFI